MVSAIYKGMRGITIAVFIALMVFVLTGCVSPSARIVGLESSGRAKIENTDRQIATNNVNRLDAISEYSVGVEYALSKVTNPPVEVKVARNINQRVAALSGTPSLSKIKEMQKTIDDLVSTLETTRKQGAQELSLKDAEIAVIQNQSKQLAIDKDLEVKQYMVVAQEAATAQAVEKQQLDKMNSWFGLGAVFYGLKKFLVSFTWIFSIGSIIFLVLRILSMSNPLAESIFSIFSLVGSWFVRAIEAIVPKAVELAGHTATEVVDLYKSTLLKIVDGVQTEIDRAKAAGKVATIEEALDDVAKTMNDDEKEVVDEIKKLLNWK
jgi:hypothetical protein